MARRRYLVAYDIRDDRRLRTVATCMEAFGGRIQYSVFICDISLREMADLRGRLETLIAVGVDSIMIIDLGALDSRRFTFIGSRTPMPDSGATII